MILSTHGIIGSQIVQISFDTDYQAVLNYATTQGYTLPSASQQTLQNQLVVDLKTAGVWSKLDTFAVFATDGNSDFALIDWKRLSKYTAVNSPTFTTNEGFQGNGTSSYINSNYRALSNGVNWTLNSAGFGYYLHTIDTVIDTGEGVFSSFGMWLRYSLKRIYLNRNYSNYTNFNSTSNQFATANRTSSTSVNITSNGTTTDTVASDSVAVVDSDCLILYSAISQFSDAKVSMVFAGGDFTTETSDFYNAWNTYFTSL